ncbi:MAG: hypothetical protein NVS4B2_15360 [Chloroflexota bacterium]
MAKLERYPDYVSAAAVKSARTLYEFDDRVTAPVHGFRDAADYYARSSSLGYLTRIRVPTLLLNAIDDPFLPCDVLDEVRIAARENPNLVVEQPEHGGHVGFVSGRLPWAACYYAESRAAHFLAAAIALPNQST